MKWDWLIVKPNNQFPVVRISTLPPGKEFLSSFKCHSRETSIHEGRVCPPAMQTKNSHCHGELAARAVGAGNCCLVKFGFPAWKMIIYEHIMPHNAKLRYISKRQEHRKASTNTGICFAIIPLVCLPSYQWPIESTMPLDAQNQHRCACKSGFRGFIINNFHMVNWCRLPCRGAYPIFRYFLLFTERCPYMPPTTFVSSQWPAASVTLSSDHSVSVELRTRCQRWPCSLS